MMLKGIYAVVLIDLKRFWLDRARIAMGLLQPLLYLFVLGAGLGSSSRLGGGNYQQFIFPGVIGLSMLFTATFAAISIVFDRQIGFFKAVLVSPVPRPAIALGKIAAGSLQAAVQGAIVLPFAPFVGVPLTPLEVVFLLGAMLLSSTMFAAIGLAFAARFTSVTVFPVVSNAVLLPMFFLSGAMYPLALAPRWMQVAAHFDPVAYAVDLMRGALLGHFFFSPWLSIGALALVIAGLAWESVRVLNRGEDDSSLGANRVWGRR
ncbi:MAG TPA: ABC transporter permease [Lacunisphaera sp.]|jgi:ABC-2 type transport system permease protein|nr:ABC transporter permease [Lacunisphaera sp.]